MADNIMIKVPAAAKVWGTVKDANDPGRIAVFDPSPQSITSATMSFF